MRDAPLADDDAAADDATSDERPSPAGTPKAGPYPPTGLSMRPSTETAGPMRPSRIRARAAGPDATSGPDSSGAPDATGGPDSSGVPDASGGPDASGVPDAGGGPDASGVPDAGNPADAGPDASVRDAAPDAPACPAASAAGNWYVDGARGVDDTAHGGGPGACAYKTMTFAVAHAKADIFVAAGTYSVAAGETLPLVLTGKQAIFCTNATLVGQGAYESSHATVVFTGSTNVLSGCTIVGDALTGSCVFIESDGKQAGHDLQSVDVSQCGDEAVDDEGTDVRVEGSSFHDSDRGVVWASGDLEADMSNDKFSNNRLQDITCQASGSGVVGSNDLDGNGDPTCGVCNYCPFN